MLALINFEYKYAKCVNHIYLLRLFFFIWFCFCSINILIAEEYYSIELSVSNNKENAIEAAKKFSEITKLPLDSGINERLKKKSRIIGPEVTVYRMNNNKFRTTAYLGKNFEAASFILGVIKKYYSKKAVLKKVNILNNINLRRSSSWQYRKLLILGSKNNYNDAQNLAKVISEKTRIPYTTRNLVFDPQKGLVFKNGERYKILNYSRCISTKVDKCISIEYSHAYKYLAPGYFIILGGLYQNSLEAKKDLALFRKFVPDAYLRKTIVYMGGM